ncbi:MAG: hypothetical protein WEB59_13675 [Thermoanaerobaculia bacterium]
MRAYVCVYRHSVPSHRDWRMTREASLGDPVLAKFLIRYQEATCFFDWGDDPSFFAATEILGDTRAASWGVCRRDVRARLSAGDFVLWFCAKQDPGQLDRWLYFFVGCSTAGEVLSRQELWGDTRFSAYTRFYNVLAKPADGGLLQHETFHRYHDDWLKRASAGYVIFDPSPRVTAINVTDPLLVATKAAESDVEVWRCDSERVRQVEAAIFTSLGITRRLRTRNRQRPHRQIALHQAPGLEGAACEAALQRLRQTILSLVA